MALPLDASIDPDQTGHVDDHETIATVLNGMSAAGDGDLAGWDTGTGAFEPVSRGAFLPVTAHNAADISTTSTSYASTGLTVAFTPRGTKATVMVVAHLSTGTAGTSVFFAVGDGTTDKSMGARTIRSVDGQDTYTGHASFTGLTPGSPVTFTVKWKVDANNVQVRQATYPDYERLSVLVLPE